MAYTKTNWSNADPLTPINDTNLNKIEQGIYDAHQSNTQNADNITLNTTNIGTHETRIDSIDASISNIENDITNNETSVFNLQKYHSWRTITSDPASSVSADNVDNIFIEWPGAVSVQLPAIPTTSDRIRIVDAGANFAINNLTVLRNGSNIMGAQNDYIFDYSNGSIEFCYSGITYGWVVTRSV